MRSGARGAGFLGKTTGSVKRFSMVWAARALTRARQMPPCLPFETLGKKKQELSCRACPGIRRATIPAHHP
jgi:hypothetical protein